MIKKNSVISVIGAGKLAYSLVPELISGGYSIRSVISRNLADAKNLARKYGIKQYYDKFSRIPQSTKVFIISVPDDQLESVSAELVKSISVVKQKYFIHFSGVMESNALREILKKGGVTASFHIIQTFPSKKKVNIKNSFVSVETPDKNLEKYLFNLAEDLSLRPFRLEPGKKIEYHLSAVFASNFLVVNIHAAEGLFRNTGIREDFYRFYEPILKSTLNNIKKAGAVNAISGPVERGDLVTIQKHISVLKKNKSLLKNYIIQSLGIISIKNEQGILTPAHKKIEEYLNTELKKVVNQVIRYRGKNSG